MELSDDYDFFTGSILLSKSENNKPTEMYAGLLLQLWQQCSSNLSFPKLTQNLLFLC